MRINVKKVKLLVPRVPGRAEFPILFLLLFLPSYMNQQALPPGLFDRPSYQLQILYQSLLILLLTLYMLRKNPPPRELSDTPLAPELEIGGTTAVLAGLGMLFLFYNFIIHLLENLDLWTIQKDPVLLTKGVMIFPALIVCLAAAAMEEFFFRGYGYFRMVQSGIGVLPAIVLTNILFAAGHVYEGLPAAGFAFVSGLFLSMAMRKGLSLFSLSAAHGIFNFSMILMSFFH